MHYVDTRTYVCGDCGFASSDTALLNKHSCDVQQHGGTCEDFPCCGHERGDCNGLLYGSDEAIKAEAHKHVMCDHEAGYYECVVEDSDDEDDDEDEDKEHSAYCHCPECY